MREIRIDYQQLFLGDENLRASDFIPGGFIRRFGLGDLRPFLVLQRSADSVARCWKYCFDDLGGYRLVAMPARRLDLATRFSAHIHVVMVCLVWFDLVLERISLQQLVLLLGAGCAAVDLYGSHHDPGASG